MCLSVVQYSWANSLGVVLLDEIILDKLMSRFAVSLVKFDVAYPYGDKHENYAKFAKEQNVLVEDMLIGDVHAKDYGDKENWGLLKRFGINEKELPTILLFKKSDPTKWIKYPRDHEVTVDNLKNFVRRNTKLYIGLSGCIQEFDTIAAAFMEKFNRNEFGDLDRLIGEATNLMKRQLDEQVSGCIAEHDSYLISPIKYVYFHRRRRWPMSTCRS